MDLKANLFSLLSDVLSYLAYHTEEPEALALYKRVRETLNERID